MNKMEFISAGAGSGKTYTLTEKLEALLSTQQVQPQGVMATTFTKLAASELQERVRQKLIESGHVGTANAMGQSLIGTVNGVCGELLGRFSFEAGLPPEQKVLDEQESARLFGQAMELALADDLALIGTMNQLAVRLGYEDAKTKQLTWRREVQQVVDAARANNMAAEQLSAFADQSVSSLLGQFPKVSSRDLSAELLDAVSTALALFDPDIDSTKGSSTYFKSLAGVQVALNHDRLTWPEWIKLSKSGPTKASVALAEPVQSIASAYDTHAQLHQDLRDFTVHVFDIAMRSLAAFQTLKARLGLIDFVDQEQRLLDVLDHPEVMAALSSELQLLMVDEFQDTSPIQLAVFVKLADLADRVIWVGDIKQSIYGFRGSDPVLMLSVLEHLNGQGVEPQILERSWRSRPGLVNYVNALFVPAFSDTLTEEQVALIATREDPIGGAVVEHWTLVGRNKAIQAKGLANQVNSMVTVDGQQIIDRHSKEVRGLRYGDIAVLCRSHANLANVASAMAERGVPVRYKRAGLLKTPESALAVACLRRLADVSDTLASAEIRALTTDQPPEDWLADRLRHLGGGHESSTWGEDAIAELGALAAERDRLRLMTPPEAFQQALEVTNVRGAVLRWCSSQHEARQRLANVDMLLSFADRYIDFCVSQNLAATVSGLILWLEDLGLQEEDWQAEAAGDAVTLVTHHGAKGLEWPVVIAMDLADEWRSRLWGLSVEGRKQGFLWENPLADRSLRYWPSFFGRQSTGIAVKEKIEASDAGQLAHYESVEESKRLLYVSLTRARDILILPLTGKKQSGPWMDSLKADWMVPKGDVLTMPNGQSIDTAIRCLDAEGCVDPTAPGPLYWPKLASPENQLIERYLSPSSAPPVEAAKIDETEAFGERLGVSGKPDMAVLGTALHSVIATEIIARDSSVARASRILADYGMSAVLDAEAVVKQTDAFIRHIEERFNPNAWHVEYPMHYTNEQGQVVRGWIDLALETDDGWVVIDHKSSPHARSEWADKALSYSGQLALYREALNGVADQPVSSCWIHFATTGGLVQVSHQ
ncbi:MAG: UvrD-helicase domain-containing protein [Motiliproteus sp.]